MRVRDCRCRHEPFAINLQKISDVLGCECAIGSAAVGDPTLSGVTHTESIGRIERKDRAKGLSATDYLRRAQTFEQTIRFR
jgi:hypothetical protein